MAKRQAAIQESYEAQWNGGLGSHHPDYDPYAKGPGVTKANRETEEMIMAIIKVRRAEKNRDTRAHTPLSMRTSTPRTSAVLSPFFCLEC